MVIRRAFLANAYPKGSPERIELNKRTATSEYYPSKPYLSTPDGKQLQDQSPSRRRGSDFGAGEGSFADDGWKLIFLDSFHGSQTVSTFVHFPQQSP
jgi:hypothetical protein